LNDGLYTVSTRCPVCEENFDVTKVKTAASKLDHVDEDLCMHYTGIDPMLYEPWICPHCGYGGFGGSFDRLSENEIVNQRKLCLMKFTQDPEKNPFELSDFHKQVYHYNEVQSSDGERDYAIALEAFKILFANLEFRHVPNSLRARALLRIAWLYRFMNDPQEIEYLQEAANCFAEAYSLEVFPIGTFDYATCAYLIGELNRRIDKRKEALDWFGKVLALPPASSNPRIVEKTRDQIFAIKNSK